MAALRGKDEARCTLPVGLGDMDGMADSAARRSALRDCNDPPLGGPNEGPTMNLSISSNDMPGASSWLSLPTDRWRGVLGGVNGGGRGLVAE